MIRVTVPFNNSTLVDFFNNKLTDIEVDTEKSLKDSDERSILVYLSNLEVPSVTVTTVTDNLLLQYMLIKEICDVISLRLVHANVLYFAKYGKVLYPSVISLFSEDRIKTFIKNNIDIITLQLMFLDSLQLYMFTRDENLKAKTEYKVDDSSYDELGFNLLTLFSLSDFMLMYSQTTPQLSDQIYFSKYFDEFIFKGKQLYSYIKNDAFFGLIGLITMGYENASAREKVQQIYDGLIRMAEDTEPIDEN